MLGIPLQAGFWAQADSREGTRLAFAIPGAEGRIGVVKLGGTRALRLLPSENRLRVKDYQLLRPC